MLCNAMLCHATGPRQAKSELGIFSEDGVEETRDLFWRKVCIYVLLLCVLGAAGIAPHLFSFSVANFSVAMPLFVDFGAGAAFG